MVCIKERKPESQQLFKKMYMAKKKKSQIKKGRARAVTKSVTKPQRKQFSGQVRKRKLHLTVYIFKFVISDLVESLQ